MGVLILDLQATAPQSRGVDLRYTDVKDRLGCPTYLLLRIMIDGNDPEAVASDAQDGI